MSIRPRTPAPGGALARLDQAVHLLEIASTLEEVGQIRNIAKAAEEYARAEKMGDDAIRHATGIKLRAARKAGELLIRMAEEGERAQPGQVNQHTSVVESAGSHHLQKLADLGITKGESRTFQGIARVPEETFEMAVANGVSESALSRDGATERPRRGGLPIGMNKRTGLRPSQRLRKVADTLGGYSAALPGLDLRGEDCSDVLAEIDAHLLAVRRAVKQLSSQGR